MRATLGGLGLGEVALQEFGEPTDVLIRIERQAGGEEAQQAAVDRVKAALAERSARTSPTAGSSSSARRSAASCSGPATQAVIYALIAILAYIWFRFEWQFGIGAMVALIHDAITTVGLFCAARARVQPRPRSRRS